VTISVVAMLAMLRVKAGGALHFSDALAYQRVFYSLGLAMLPLPMPIHPWQAIMGIYVMGFVIALTGWRSGSPSAIHDILLCSALMGVGLFTYYQGRSHIYCLMAVLWPAMLIGAILTDQVLAAVRERQITRYAVALALPFVLFVSLGSITFLMAVPGLLKAEKSFFASFGKTQDALVGDEIRFMRTMRGGRRCLILSQRQAIYYAELGYASPLPGPGMIETILKSDFDALVAAVREHPPACMFVGEGKHSKPSFGMDTALLTAHYDVIATSPMGTMNLLLPRETPPR
jgi:hypothetical protein